MCPVNLGTAILIMKISVCSGSSDGGAAVYGQYKSQILTETNDFSSKRRNNNMKNQTNKQTHVTGRHI